MDIKTYRPYSYISGTYGEPYGDLRFTRRSILTRLR
jgi:hypothetical protein